MNATIFATYGKVLEHLDSKEALSHWWAGCAAGIAQTAIISPVELIKETVYITSGMSHSLCGIDDYTSDSLSTSLCMYF